MCAGNDGLGTASLGVGGNGPADNDAVALCVIGMGAVCIWRSGLCASCACIGECAAAGIGTIFAIASCEVDGCNAAMAGLANEGSAGAFAREGPCTASCFAEGVAFAGAWLTVALRGAAAACLGAAVEVAGIGDAVFLRFVWRLVPRLAPVSTRSAVAGSSCEIRWRPRSTNGNTECSFRLALRPLRRAARRF